MTLTCNWQNYQSYIKRYKRAKAQNDLELMNKLKAEIKEFCRRCGAIENETLNEILELNPSIKEAPAIIRGMIQNGNVEQAELITHTLNQVLPPVEEKQKPSKMTTGEIMARNFSNIQGSIVVARNMISSSTQEDFPEICSEECQHVQCPYRRSENYGKPCLQRLEQYKNKYVRNGDFFGR